MSRKLKPKERKQHFKRLRNRTVVVDGVVVKGVDITDVQMVHGVHYQYVGTVKGVLTVVSPDFKTWVVPTDEGIAHAHDAGRIYVR